MKFLRRLSLFVVLALMVLPLVIRAQDGQPQPPPSDDDDLIVPIPPKPADDLDDDLIVPIPPKPSDDDLIVPIPPKPSEDPDDDLIVPIPPKPTRTPRPKEPTTMITNGMWVMDPNGSTFSSTGSCKLDNGDNGGPDKEGDNFEELPKVPVCMTSDGQWLSVNSDSAYPLVVPNFYSQQQMNRELLYTDGKTSGSINVNTTRQYHVISTGEIVFSYIRNEDGGCTTNSSVSYRLVQADAAVCSANVVATPNYTPIPTEMPTPQPGETQQPPITPEPPIQIGEYTIELPPLDDTCTADKMPSSDKINLDYDNNQNLFINFGGGSYTLYWDGGDYYSYSEGNTFDISMVTYPGGASFSWSKEGCFLNSPLDGAGFPAAETSEQTEVEPDLEPTMDVASIAGSTYTVTTESASYLCADENKDMLPDLSGAVLTAQADNTFKFSAGGVDYTLTDMSGIMAFTEAHADGSLFTITMNGFTDGVGSGIIMALTADGSKSCMAQLTFTP